MKLSEWSWSASLDLSVSTNLREWLLYPGSFMQRLGQRGIDASIHVLQQCWHPLEPWEEKLLGMKFHAKALVREVLIVSEKKYWMFARTVIPEQTLTGKHQELAHLNDRSLGSVLFQDPEMKRGEFEFTCLQADLLWSHIPELRHIGIESTDLWARRSIFLLQKKPLLLTEIFLPDIITV